MGKAPSAADGKREIKRRSRHGTLRPKRRTNLFCVGCHNCKRRKIKVSSCFREVADRSSVMNSSLFLLLCRQLTLCCRPTCSHCNSKGFYCDYSIKLTWGGKQIKGRNDGADFNVQFHHQHMHAPQNGHGLAAGTVDLQVKVNAQDIAQIIRRLNNWVWRTFPSTVSLHTLNSQ